MFEMRSRYVAPGDESDMWEGVTQELMSDEEDCGSSLKIRTPIWRAPAITELVKQLDLRNERKLEEDKRQVPKKKRIVASSPMKRLPSKKVKRQYIWTETDEQQLLN